uniref:Uncharacterized protein n=1 Tax=Arundo donax TaxID=35708 RepID=A0A0A9F3M8_ARUDO
MAVDNDEKIFILCSNDDDAQLLAESYYASGDYPITFFYVADLCYCSHGTDYLDWIKLASLRMKIKRNLSDALKSWSMDDGLPSFLCCSLYFLPITISELYTFNLSCNGHISLVI